MRKLLLSTAALGMIAAGGASAQVVNDLDLILQGLTTIQTSAEAAVSNVAGVAQNSADIDASIVIDATGQGGATAANDAAASNSASDSALLAITGLELGSAFSFAGDGAGNTSLPLIDCTTLADGDSGAGECGLDVDGLLAASTASASAAASNAASATQVATTQDFGAVAATAIGAANLHTIDTTMNGVTTATGSASNSSSTAASASSDIVFAASVNALNVAENSANIDAFFDGTFTGGNVSFDSIETTAIGAVNSGGIIALINGD